jgi:hypothetical protein
MTHSKSFRRIAAAATGLTFVLLLPAQAAHAHNPSKAQSTRSAPNQTNSPSITAPASIIKVETPDQLWKQIQSASVADLKYARILADNVGSPGAKLRSACYGAWITTIEQSQGIGLNGANGASPTLPDPHVFASFEQIAQVADNLQPTGPLMSACAPVWTALKLSAMQFITLVVSGAAGLAVLGVTIP